MPRPPRSLLLAHALLVAAPSIARADPPLLPWAPAPAAQAAPAEPALNPADQSSRTARETTTGAGEFIAIAGSTESYTEDWLVSPRRELEVGGHLRLVMSPDSPFGEREIRLTDIALFHAAARYSFGERGIEVAAGLDLLAKQPSYLDEPVFYGGDLGARMALGETGSWAAWGRAAGAPLLAEIGVFGEVAAGVQARTSIDETIRFQAALGAAGTRLFRDDEAGGPAWFAETVAHGEASFVTPRGEFGCWVGVDYRLPVAHGDGDSAAGDIDPQVRLNLQLGMVLGYVDDWDLYMTAGITDRGDIEDPATTLPILEGGFDQTQFILGAARRFGLADTSTQSIAM